MDIFTPHEIYGMAAEFFGIDPEMLEEAARRTNSKPRSVEIGADNHVYGINIDFHDGSTIYFSVRDENALFRAYGT